MTTYYEHAEKMADEIEKLSGLVWPDSHTEKVVKFIANELASNFWSSFHRSEQEVNDKANEAKRADKIRDAFQANYRAALNLLSSMTAEERLAVLDVTTNTMRLRRPSDYAILTAREACVATWGAEAVAKALGDA